MTSRQLSLQVMTKNNVKAVQVLNSDSAAFKLALAGQTPEVAMSAAMASIQFCKSGECLWPNLDSVVPGSLAAQHGFSVVCTLHANWWHKHLSACIL
jgi:hypothetical protein